MATTETPAQMAARFRKMAQDPKLPQAVKNTYLDKANEVEKAAAKPTMNKGGAVKKHKMPDGKMMKDSAMRKPAIALIIGVGKPMSKPMKKPASKK
jgi:hypothetical protein